MFSLNIIVFATINIKMHDAFCHKDFVLGKNITQECRFD